MKYIFSLIFLFCILITGCKQNIDSVDIIDAPEIPVLLTNYNPIVIDITSSVFGTVVDEMGEIVEGAVVTIDGLSETTDPFGTFKFENITMNKNGTFVQIEKPGFFKSGRRFFPQNAETNRVRIELIRKEFTHEFKTETGGEVSFENNGKVVFAPNSIQKENGESYMGGVNVAIKWLDPTAPKTLDQMPGALQGVTLDGQEKVLETFGMLAVELEDTNGEPLNIASNEMAEIHMPVPNELLGNAPNEIPLWSFNYEYGIWEEEGKAMLENGFYVGNVSHFSFWNCDYPRSLANMEMTILEESSGKKLKDIKVEISLLNGSSSGSGYSNSIGEVSGLIPVNELLQLKIYDKCDDLYLEQEIGPFSSNIDLGEINISVGEKVILTGALLNCNGEKINQGLVIVKLGDNQSFYEVNDTLFDLLIPVCNASTMLEVAGGDISNFEMSEFLSLPIEDSLKLGAVVACGEALADYAIITVKGVTSTIYPLQDQGPDVSLMSTVFIFDDPDVTTILSG